VWKPGIFVTTRAHSAQPRRFVGEKQFLEVAKAERRGVKLPAPSF